jgi:hypothetical protein
MATNYTPSSYPQAEKMGDVLDATFQWHCQTSSQREHT